MQMLTPPCFVHHSADANQPRSASQTRQKRRTSLPASLLSPPIMGTTGEAKSKPAKLLLGCAQASTPIKGTFCKLHPTCYAQRHQRPLVTSIYSHLALFEHCISPIEDTSTLDYGKTSLSLPLSLSLVTTKDNSTLVSTVRFDAGRLEPQDSIDNIDSKCSMMISAAAAAAAATPDTPPELTESRSSKSSSYDSRYSTENDLSTEITNFEDIGLDDDTNSDAKQTQHRAHASTHQSARRETYKNRRPTVPEINCHVKPRASNNAPRSAVVAPIRRGFTSPSTVPLASQSSRPRSSSPPKRLPRSVSSFSVNLSGSAQGSSPRTSITHSRRGSWQPQRKTIKEIEDEYHDSDDELPEDASLWNVPISPCHSAGVSPMSSFRGSPERESYMKSPRPIPLEHTRSTPDQPARNASNSQQTQRKRLNTRSVSTYSSHSNPSSPRMPSYIRNNRSKSWNIAMSELSPEARIVSENLVYHTETSRPKDQGSDRSETNVLHRSSAPSAIQLPPIQRGPLDFMPISKEKEKVLSRTRPSWLPPKDPREEQKHLKEYQKMMAASIEAEKKKETKLKTTQCQKDSTRESINRIWDYYINPTTDINAIDRRVHDLCWHGIPSRVRGQVWQRAVGNPLALTTRTYNKALERAQVIKTKSSHDLTHLERSIASWFVDIDRDAEVAFPELGVFQRNGPLWQDLVNICEAYACYRSDIGYIYGLQLIAALILLQIPNPCDAFVFMANCLNKPIPLAFHTSDISSTQRTYNRVVANLGVKFPRLHDYLFEPMDRGGLGLTGQELLEPMFRTLFANGLDFDRLCRAWDIWIFEGDRTLVRVAVAVLGSLQAQIFNVSGDAYLKRRNVQEMLGWGPFNRIGTGSYWKLEVPNKGEAFVDEIEAAGKLDYTGR